MNKYSRELPVELVTEVLVWLPVKSLVRFRCVCKAWFALISSSDFASLHLSRSHKNDDDTSILAVGRDLQWMLISGLAYEKFTSDDFSILNNENNMDDFGDFDQHGCSVNGLILLSRDTYDPLHDVMQLELVMWNPMIGKSHKFPAEFGLGDSVAYGFGFSHASNDYKVVVIVHDPVSNLVYVYSFRTRTWRGIVGYSESMAHDVFCDGDCLIDGKIHFQNWNIGSYSLAVFDVDNEELSHVLLPCFMGEYKAFAYHDRLGLLDFDHEKPCWNLWVMGNDEAPPGSWHKLYTIGLHIGPFSMISLCFKKDELFMLFSGKYVELYNVKSGVRKHLREISSYYLRYFTLYKESLVLL